MNSPPHHEYGSLARNGGQINYSDKQAVFVPPHTPEAVPAGMQYYNEAPIPMAATASWHGSNSQSPMSFKDPRNIAAAAYPVPPPFSARSGGESAPIPVAYERGGRRHPGERTILGLRPATFFLSLALIVVVIVAAVVGGVGGTMAIENTRRTALAEGMSSAAAGGTNGTRATATATVTVTVRENAQGVVTQTETQQITKTGQSTPAPTTSASSDDNAPLKVKESGNIEFDCDAAAGNTSQIDLQGQKSNFKATCGRDYNGKGVDIVNIISYTYMHCIKACAVYNFNLGKKGCVAVTYHANLDSIVKDHFGNCFLKNTTNGANDSSRKTVAGFELV